MIEKKLCINWEAWSHLVSDLMKEGCKIYYGTLPDFPFIAVYETRLSYRHVTFITKDDFKIKKI